MSQPHPCDDKALLVSYVYDECDPLDRQRLEEHLASCAACDQERDQLRAVRGALAEWQSPDRALGFKVVQDPPAESRSGWPRVPAWAQAAAAVLVLAAGAAIANLEVRYGAAGFAVRTGWQQPSSALQQTSPAVPVASGRAAPWRLDLAALERQLRQEFSGLQEARGLGQAALAAPERDASTRALDEALLRRVRALIDESEQRQQRDLALRLTHVVRDFDVQRRGDLVRIEQGFGQIEGAAVTQQRELLDYLVRVSQRR